MKKAPRRKSRARNRTGALLALVALVATLTACGSSAGLTPVAYPDPSAPCPAGRAGWKLEVLDRRASREGSEAVVELIGDSIRRSFPGCRWDAEAGADAGLVRVEVHRFATVPSGNTWDAAAEWTVTATDAAGATLTEFEADEELSRPDYRGSNNQKESLREVFDRALRRTLAGLRVVSSARLAVLRSGRRAVLRIGAWNHIKDKPRARNRLRGVATHRNRVLRGTVLATRRAEAL